MVFLLNSAAPSVFAKQYRDFLDDNTGCSGDPIVVSITSEHDTATGLAHPVANVFAGFRERNKANYKVGRGDAIFDVPADYFYRRTPGHNPFLVTHEIAAASAPDLAPYNGDAVIEFNLKSGGRDLFFTSNEEAENPPLAWHLYERSSANKFYQFNGKIIPPSKSRYWVVRCKSPLMTDHGDIWTYRSVEMLCALFHIALSKPSVQNH